jgi:sugar phosphate isomerase/epimerase
MTMFDAASRREFFRVAASRCLGFAVGGLAAGASNIGLAAFADQRVSASKLKTSLNAYSFSKLLNDFNKGLTPGVSLLELVDFCVKHDFDGLDPTGYFFPGYPDVPTDKYIYQLKRHAFSSGIGISGTGVRNNFTTADKSIRDAGVEHIKQWVEVAAKLGAPVLRVFADTQMRGQSWQTVAPDCSRDQVEEWIAGCVRQCAEQGEKYGVIIGVQNHGDFLKTSAEHLSLVKRVESPWCGPIVDTGYYKTDDPYLDIAAVAPHAVNWQIKESPFGAGNNVRTDMKRLLTIIRQSGYRGYLPIETLSVSGKEYDPFDLAPKFLTELRDAMEATTSIVGQSPLEESRALQRSPSMPPDDSPVLRKKANKKSKPTTLRSSRVLLKVY